MIDLQEIQQQQADWSFRNFGNQPSTQPLLGIVEEVGELSHAVLKRAQGIRTNEDHQAAIDDAVGDIVIYLMDFCSKEGINLETAIQTVWLQVQERDWTQNKVDGMAQ